MNFAFRMRWLTLDIARVVTTGTGLRIPIDQGDEIGFADLTPGADMAPAVGPTLQQLKFMRSRYRALGAYRAERL